MTNSQSKITHIKTIEIKEDTGFFSNKNFVLNDITNFSVIAGINGSGKTKLLEYISKNYNQNTSLRYIKVGYQLQGDLSVNEINGKTPNYKSFNINETNADGNIFVFVNKNNDKSFLHKSHISGVITENFDYSIMLNIIEKRKKWNNITTAECIYREKKLLDELKTTKSYQDIMKKLLPEEPKNDEPWERIDRIFQDCNLQIRIDRANLNACVEFIKYPDDKLLKISDLSSGEKVAFTLALWTWGSTTGQKTEVLLIDEFDAHLNPSIAEKFIEIIQKYFVDYGVQVFMTTHNPSTIVYAKQKGAQILWMEDGKINKTKEYPEIVNDLSNGLIDILDLEKEVQLIIQSNKKRVVYTEGKTDKTHIENAIEKLDMTDKFKYIYIFGSTGASTVRTFIKELMITIPTNQEIKIALYDTDKEGTTQAKILQDKLLNAKICFVSKEDDKEIEDLFDEDLLKKQIASLFEKDLSKKDLSKEEKKKLKNFMAANKELKEEDYAGFKPLLEEILTLSNTKN